MRAVAAQVHRSGEPHRSESGPGPSAPFPLPYGRDSQRTLHLLRNLPARLINPRQSERLDNPFSTSDWISSMRLV